MKKSILILILTVCATWAFQPPYMQDSVPQKSLQNVALCPLGLPIRDTLLYTPQNIRARFGSPDSAQEQKTLMGKDSIYFYRNTIITFHATGHVYYLSFLEITGGRIGDLSIGMTRGKIDSTYGRIGMMDGREIRTFGDDDQYELWLDFESDKLVRITPNWSRASLEIMGIYH